jgi:hypothetical protein
MNLKSDTEDERYVYNQNKVNYLPKIMESKTQVPISVDPLPNIVPDRNCFSLFQTIGSLLGAGKA